MVLVMFLQKQDDKVKEQEVSGSQAVKSPPKEVLQVITSFDEFDHSYSRSL